MTKKYRAGKPTFHRDMEFVAITDIPKYNLNAGDDFKGERILDRITTRQMYYNNHRIGPKDHPWTVGAIEAHLSGKTILPFAQVEEEDKDEAKSPSGKAKKGLVEKVKALTGLNKATKKKSSNSEAKQPVSKKKDGGDK